MRLFDGGGNKQIYRETGAEDIIADRAQACRARRRTERHHLIPLRDGKRLFSVTRGGRTEDCGHQVVMNQFVEPFNGATGGASGVLGNERETRASKLRCPVDLFAGEFKAVDHRQAKSGQMIGQWQDHADGNLCRESS